MKDEKQIKTKGFWWNLGKLSYWLREKWILTILIGLAAIAAGVLPRYEWSNGIVELNGRMGSASTIILTVLAILAALAVFLDKVADKHSQKEAILLARAEESAGLRVLAVINSVLGNIHEVAYSKNSARGAKIETLRAQVAAAAALIPAANLSRAAYYPLRYEGKFRILDNPKDDGRNKQATSVFFEENDPNHPIWEIMDSKDTACEIRSSPEDCGVNWSAKKYKTFISVPVRAEQVTFGMLSINAPAVGDLTEMDRVATISLARMMAAVLALERGPRKLASDAKK